MVLADDVRPLPAETEDRAGGSAGAPLPRACRVAVPPNGSSDPLPALRASAGADFAVSVVWYGTPWRGLILPPPGGGPYLATISGGAMIALLPRTRVVSVVGSLSSSTHTYSGSLRTSPKRGFLMSTQRVSADLRLMVGSPGPVMPSIERTVLQPDAATSTTSNTARDHTFMRRIP